MRKALFITLFVVACGDDVTPAIDASSPPIDSAIADSAPCPRVPVIVTGVVRCDELGLSECLTPLHPDTGFGLICEPHTISPAPCFCKSHLPTPYGDDGAWCMR